MALGCHGLIDVLYSEREGNDSALRMARAVKLSQLVREFHVGCERIQVFDGPPESTLPPIAATRAYDVIVMGARSQKPAGKPLFGTMSSRIVDATSGDVVLVNGPGREIPLASSVLSARDQRPDESQQFF
jgi:nucleotide-binding universal stress UspA family protein